MNDELLNRFLDNFDGTPEEAGVLLNSATNPIVHANDPERYYSARNLIREHGGGRELLDAEDAASQQ